MKTRGGGPRALHAIHSRAATTPIRNRPSPVPLPETEAIADETWRRVRIVVEVTVTRSNPTPEAEMRDAKAQVYLQQLLDMDMEDRAARLEALLNQASSTV